MSELATSIAAELRREYLTIGNLMKAICSIIDNIALAEVYVMSYPFLPNLDTLVELVLQGAV